MNKLKISRIIAGLSVTVGLMVMVGWYFDIVILTSILPQMIRMKVATALCFVFSGIIIYFLSFEKEEKKEINQIVLTVFPMLLVLIMGTLFLGSVFGFQTGMENISFFDIHELKTPIFQGRPSVLSMISFLLIAFIGLLFNINKPSKNTFTVIGLIVATIGLVGVLGYITHIPFLYYEIAGFSNAIALHTTILFSFLGLSIFLIGNEKNNNL